MLGFLAIVQVMVRTAQYIGSLEQFKTIIFSKILHKVKFRDFSYRLTET